MFTFLPFALYAVTRGRWEHRRSGDGGDAGIPSELWQLAFGKLKVECRL